jgi:3',5'-cyclic AMP phosphodiesterase CpdA
MQAILAPIPPFDKADQSMTVLRVLHVSDLHARQGLRTDQREIAEAMVRDAARLRDERPFDLAVVTGDLAFAGKTSEFALAREILLGPLETELDLGPDRVVIAPGNHDVDRKLISDEARLRGRLVDRASVNELLDDEAQRAAACARLEAWESFAGSTTKPRRRSRYRRSGGCTVSKYASCESASRPSTQLGDHLAMTTTVIFYSVIDR